MFQREEAQKNADVKKIHINANKKLSCENNAKKPASSSSTKKQMIKKGKKKSNADDLKSFSDSEENKKSVKQSFSIKNIPKNNTKLLGYDWIKGSTKFIIKILHYYNKYLYSRCIRKC